MTQTNVTILTPATRIHIQMGSATRFELHTYTESRKKKRVVQSLLTALSRQFLQRFNATCMAALTWLRTHRGAGKLKSAFELRLF